MDIVKLSPEGQILISRALLQGAGFAPGTEFAVRITSMGLTLTPTEPRVSTPFAPTSNEQVRGFLQGKNTAPFEDDETTKQRIKARLHADDEASKR